MKPKTPKTPVRDFPLFQHRNGQWAKKVRGKLHYFGTDRDAALQRWVDEKDDLLAGRAARARGKGLTLRELCNWFLTSKRWQRDAGELTSRTWGDYYRICEMLIDFFGGGQLVPALQPEDFDRFRAKLATVRGPVAIGNAINRTRIVMKWALDNDLIERPVRFGTVFKKPAKKSMRLAKEKGGSRVLSAEDVRTLIGAAKAPMRAMILLGVNCGFGQNDVATLPLDAIDLDSGWIDFRRPKTGIMRRCALWLETVEALRAAQAERPTPADLADAPLAFLTHRGAKWIREAVKADTDQVYFNDYIASEFAKLATRLGVKRRGSFYNLRHTFRTVADGCKDQAAIDCVMGHTRGTMAEEYRDGIDNSRLRAVADFVRAWLFPEANAGTAADSPAALSFAQSAR